MTHCSRDGKRVRLTHHVIPAQAGTQPGRLAENLTLGARLRGHDGL